ncbi:helix-turn-helix domain-containing protein [Streptomyces lydicus]|uniref:helix-turn-helix domain-containing protein n=1 Tax=Streptomyces lydicus TaxID=47763 RepID=UPI00101032CC|nr:XRE family transcriptional regulator [Streptomyces lydicus]MCZ1006648.1 helix-turn-helix domain-containing protein [Streptomyces lydicus]
MSRWRPLPDSLDTDAQRLAEELRALKERTGLSLDGLARKTPYSKSAWHRYLNGEKLPPRNAVEALGQVAGADQEPLLAVYDAAHHARTAPLATPPVPPTAPALPTAPLAAEHTGLTAEHTGWARQLLRTAGVLRTIGALVALTALVATMGAAAAIVEIPARAARTDGGASHECHGHRCQGRYPWRPGCNRDARAESTIVDTTYTVRLRFSPSCGTVWSEVQPRSGGAQKVSIWVGRDARLTSHTHGREGLAVSPMLATSDLRQAVACARVTDRVACTGAIELTSPAGSRDGDDFPGPKFLERVMR